MIRLVSQLWSKQNTPVTFKPNAMFGCESGKGGGTFWFVASQTLLTTIMIFFVCVASNLQLPRLFDQPTVDRFVAKGMRS